MAKGSIDYDYDEVISYIPGAPCTAVNDLATNLNTLGGNLDNMQDQFHSSDIQQVVGQIYVGFSNIIGDKTKGLSKLVIESANIINICYDEAKSDKEIVENGELGGSGSTNNGDGTSNMEMGSGKSLDKVTDYINEHFPTDNWGESFEKDMKESGNLEAYVTNLDNLTQRLSKLQEDMEKDGYTFTVNGFSGGKHSASQSAPSHYMGAKSDITFYKDGQRISAANITAEDIAYIENALRDNGLGMQYETYGGGTGWGDVYLDHAYNKNGDLVTYDGTNWGSKDNSIYNSNTNTWSYK